MVADEKIYIGNLQRTRDAIDDVRSLNNSMFGDNVDPIYPTVIEITDSKKKKLRGLLHTLTYTYKLTVSAG